MCLCVCVSQYYNRNSSLHIHTGNILYLTRVSPSMIILDPPEKLVIEVESSGAYERLQWDRNQDSYSPSPNATFPATPERFINFYETYVCEPTSHEDTGLYEVSVVQMRSQNVGNARDVKFNVIPYGTYMCTIMVFRIFH